jgi:hypothetical protein
VLLAATLPPGEQMDVTDLADCWWRRFGFLTGVRVEDAAILNQHGIFIASREDLQANGAAFRRLLLDLGHARDYADGVMVVRLRGNDPW